jgi:malonate-semialdehyde dehydrogenase (acetylating)/methylmalonate-semialdehyde dehydrogenase
MSSNTTQGLDSPQNYIDGNWQAPSGDAQQPVIDTATNETISEVTFSGTADVDAAVDTGQEAFTTWSETPVEERIQPLFELKRLLEEEQSSIAETLVREHGKTFDEAMGELRRGIENVEVACGIPSMMQAGHLPNAAPEIDESAVRKPLGVFAAVTPFNFPGMITLWFLPFAVATGNSFVLKPSEKTPHTAQRIMELVDEAGFPDGVVQMVHGGADTVNALLSHDGIEGVSFVGSTPVARHIYETAAANGKRVQAQGGAKNHVIVADSADLAFAADQTVSSAFANAGQRCLANPVAVVEESVYDEFADLVVERSEALTIADGLTEGADMGPLISPAHREHVFEYIETGIGEDGTLLTDGREADMPAEGTFLGPTVFGDVPAGATIAREEIFGPVLALIRADDFDHALDIVNQSDYGNAASLFTERGADARQFRHQVEAGNLAVNAGTAAPMAFFSFGGWDDSFFGDLHAQGEDMIHFYTDKAIYIERWATGS